MHDSFVEVSDQYPFPGEASEGGGEPAAEVSEQLEAAFPGEAPEPSEEATVPLADAVAPPPTAEAEDAAVSGGMSAETWQEQPEVGTGQPAPEPESRQPVVAGGGVVALAEVEVVTIAEQPSPDVVVSTRSTSGAAGSADNKAEKASSEKPEKPDASGGKGGGKPPEDAAPAVGDADDDRKGEGSGEQGDADGEARQSQEAQTAHFNRLLDGVLEQNQNLGQGAKFRIIEGEDGPDVVVYHDRPAAEEEAKPERVAFAISNPTEVTPMSELGEDSPWHFSKEDPARPLATQHVISEFAKVAPNMDTYNRLVGVFQGWVGSEQFAIDAQKGGHQAHVHESDTEGMERAERNRQSRAFTYSAKALVHGAIHQYDVAVAEGRPADLDRALATAGEAILNQGEHTYDLNSLTVSLAEAVGRTISGTLIAPRKSASQGFNKDWEGVVSKEAACHAAVAMADLGISNGPFLMKAAFESGAAQRDPEVADALHGILISDRGAQIASAELYDPQRSAEMYMHQYVTTLREDEGRNQNMVEGLLRASPKPVSEAGRRLPIPNVLQLADGLARKEGEPGRGVDSFEDLALAGEGFLYLLGLTRNHEDVETMRQQFAQDAVQAEIIGAVAEAIPRPNFTRRELTLFDLLDRYPDLPDKDAERLIRMYSEGRLTRGYAFYRSRQRANGPGYRANVRRPGWGRMS